MSTDFQPDWKMPISEYARIQKESMPKIKPLVWHAASHSFDMDVVARSNVGNFYVTGSLVGVWKSWFGNDCTGRFNSCEEAKSACQKEYERRVRECLM